MASSPIPPAGEAPALGAPSKRSQLALAGPRRSLEVLGALVRADLLARYGRGPFQLVKWLLDPVALVGVYLLLVTFVLDRAGSAPGLSLACAVVPFQLLLMTIVNAMSAVRMRRAIIVNVAFRRSLIPVVSVATETIAFAGSLILLAAMMGAYGVAPTAAVLLLPLVVAANIVLALGCAYLASLVGLWFRELQPFALSFVRAMFFLAPGLVTLAEVPDRAASLVRLNPLTGLFESYRAVLLYGEAPAAWQLLYPVAFGLVLLAVLVPVYRREQAHFAKVV
jgi:lipopolysaccharide transport system permease protein